MSATAGLRGQRTAGMIATMKRAPLHLDRERIAEFCRRQRIRCLALFGSVLRDDFGPESDVDVLVEFEPGHVPDFFRLYTVEQELSALFGGRSVDIVTYRALNRHLREPVLASAQVQYEQG
jgi:predicted nucleotidyltransferase